MALLILANILFFIMTATALCRTRVGTTRKDEANLFHSKQKFGTTTIFHRWYDGPFFLTDSAQTFGRFRAIFVLFILMGVCWITEVISFAVGGSAYLWIPTDILNILTAVFVFFIFVCKPSVWSLLMKKHPSLQKFDRLCPNCMKYDNGQQENEDRSFLQQTSIWECVLQNHVDSTTPYSRRPNKTKLHWDAWPRIIFTRYLIVSQTWTI